MSKIRIVILLILIFSNNKKLFASESYKCSYVFLDDKLTKIPLNQLTPVDDLKFKPINCAKISFGMQKKPLLIKINLINGFQNKRDYNLVISYPPLQDVEFLYKNDLSNQNFRTGINYPLQTRPVISRNFVFPFIYYAQNSNIYLKIQTYGSLQAPISIGTDNALISAISFENICYGIYYGIFLAMILYNLFIFVSVREAVYVYYVLYVLSFTLFQFTFNGLSYIYLWDKNPIWNMYSILYFICLMFFFIFLFFNNYLYLKSINKKLYIINTSLNILMASIIIFMSLTLKDAYIMYEKYMTFIVSICIINATYLLIVSAYFSIKKHYHARYFFIAWSLFLSGIVLMSLKNLGFIGLSWISNYLMQIGSASEVILLSFGLAYRIKKTEQENKLKSLENEVLKKSSHHLLMMTQMLAHDIRKPFALLKILLQALKSVKSIAEIKIFTQSVAPKIDSTLKNVEGMLEDIIEINQQNKNNCNLQEINPHDLILTTLNTEFNHKKSKIISFNYDFKHTRHVLGDLTKINRVFSNIIDNAIEACPHQASIWFKTKELSENGKNYIEFCIGNSGSFIEKSDLNSVFNQFFTKGKSSGTGLGLAIAQKIVTDHYGKIWCRSSSTENFTEFFFTLPTTDLLVEYKKVPGNSLQIAGGFICESICSTHLSINAEACKESALKNPPRQ